MQFGEAQQFSRGSSVVERCFHKAEVRGFDPHPRHMPIFKTRNEDFFKKWTPEMAYVLGFFAADGNMIKNKRGAHFIEFQITDKNLLHKIRKLLGSNHKITTRRRNSNCKNCYRLQIGSKEIFNDLLKLGMAPNKSKTIDLPFVPDKYFSDFVRGYFDGDGCVSCGIYNRKNRKSKNYLFNSRFTSGSKIFLENLLEKFRNNNIMKGGFIYDKRGSFDLVFSTNDTKKLFRFMYSNIKNCIFLERKYNKFCEGLKLLENHFV